MVEIPDDAVEAAERALCNQHHAHPLTDEEWAMIRRELSDGTDQRVNARLAVEAAAPPIAARVRAEAVAEGEAVRRLLLDQGCVSHLDEDGHTVSMELTPSALRSRDAAIQAQAVADERVAIGRLRKLLRDCDEMPMLFEGRPVVLVADVRAALTGSVPVATPRLTDVATPEPLPGCAHCMAHGSDHRRVGGKPFAVWVGRERDSDGAPNTLHVSYAAGHHLGEGEAEFVRRALRSAPSVATPTEPADEWGAPCSCIGDELGNHDPACDEGQRPIPNTEPPASPVPAKQPEPWFRETHESLALLEAERAEVAAVEAAAGQLDEQCAFEEQDDCPRHSPDASLRPVGQPEER